MQISKITDTFSVSPQIGYDNVKTLAGQGYKAIVNHRPDGEEATQPLFKSARKSRKKSRHCLSLYPVQTGSGYG